MATASHSFPPAAIEAAVTQRLVSHGNTVVEVSKEVSDWPRYVQGWFQNVRVFSYPRTESADSTSAALGPSDGTDLDSDTRRQGIRHINFLRIADEGMVRQVLKGAATLLSHSRIDHLQFYFDTFDIRTGQTIVNLLLDRQYVLFQVLVDDRGDIRLERFILFDPSRPRKTALLVACHERTLLMLYPNRDSVKLQNQFTLGISQGFPMKGIIHIGAHDGSREVEGYDMIFSNCLMIEANPEVYKKLEERCQGNPKFVTANKAISDKTGPIQFHVTSYDESSSILKPATVLEHYSGLISEVKVVEVEGITLDDLIEEKGLDPASFNYLTMDIQGAELMALSGAVKTLQHIDILQAEVNFENMYEGCGQIEEIDDFLAGFGFRRVMTASIHPAWGDAIYSKPANNPPSSAGAMDQIS